MLGKLKKPVVDRDRVVIIEEDGNADVATVYDTTSEAVYAYSSSQEYAVPVADLKSFVGPSGRVYLLAADPDYIRDTRRLAELEKSIVLRQVTHFEKPKDEKHDGINLRQIMLYVLIGILVLAVIFK